MLDYDRRIVYSLNYSLNASSHFAWTIDDNIITTTNYYTLSPSVQCPPASPNCSDPSLQVSFDVSRYCDGEPHHLSAWAYTGSSELLAGLTGNPFVCTGGGASLPPATDLPVIFVPGIMGSVIKGPFQDGTGQYWTSFNPTNNPNFPSVYNLTLDPTSKDFRPGLAATDALRCADFSLPFCIEPIYKPILDNLKAMGFSPEYDVVRHFEQNQGCDYSLKNPDITRPPNARLFVFPYDWRQDNSVTATKLKAYVKCVQQLYPPGTKVNIVAHSMGGLVVRKYILKAQQSSEPHWLGKVVTIASPFLGSPESTYKLYTGGDFEAPSSLVALSQSSIRFLAPYLYSMHQLLPSRKYHQFHGGIITERGDLDGNGIANEKYGFDRIVNILNSDFPSTFPGTIGAVFHDVAGQDDWSNDSSGIRYFHIFGNQKQFNTTDGVYVGKDIRCRKAGIFYHNCFSERLYIPQKGPGDKTVPIISTSMGWAGGYLNAPLSDLAPPGMRIFRRNSVASNTDASAEHTGLTKDDKVRDLLSYILGVGQQPAPNSDLYELTRPSLRAAKVKENPSDYSAALYLSILGQTDLTVHDQAGHAAMIVDGLLQNNVEGLSSFEFISDDSSMLTFSTGDTYTVEFRAGATPLGIELLRGVGNENVDLAIRYKDIDLPANTHVKLTVFQGGGAEVRADADGDGSYETVISPTVTLNGSAASDTTPPNVRIDLTAGDGNTAVVMVTPDDIGSGVNRVWYSIDGQNFNVYTSPFTVTLSSNPITIEAFADDNSANRSALASRTVSLSSSVMPVAECISADQNGKRVWFGYQNQTANLVSVAVGGDNLFMPLPGNNGQPTSFQPGTATHVFSALLRGKRIIWKLRGLDGLMHSATASLATTPSCN